MAAVAQTPKSIGRHSWNLEASMDLDQEDHQKERPYQIVQRALNCWFLCLSLDGLEIGLDHFGLPAVT